MTTVDIALDHNIAILTTWCAVSPEAEHSLFPDLVRSMQKEPEMIPAWETLLRELDATRLIRLSNRLRSQGEKGTALDLSHFRVEKATRLWQGQPIGQVQTYFKALMPHETQARLAYELFYDQFRVFLARQHQLVALSESDYHLELLLPAGRERDMPALWRAFVDETFAAPSLREGFVNLVNTVKLADRGFSALNVPIVSQHQAVLLSAFYLTNLNSLLRGDRRREAEISKQREKMSEAGEKEAARHQRQIAKLEKELADRQRYAPLYERVAELREQYPAKFAQVERFVGEFRGPAGTQISKVGSKIGKAIQHMAELLALEDDNLYQLPPLVTAEPPTYAPRAAGDDNSKLCYACGRVLSRGEATFTANKFIFASPSQRPQSASAQKQPAICGVCAALSFVSAIKVGGGRLIVRMQPQSDPLSDSLAAGRHNEPALPERMGDQLRMFIMGELGLVAGRYVLLQATEKVDDKLLADQLGGAQYALYKVAVSFLPEVFRRFRIVAVVGDTEVTLANGQLAVMRRLSDIFGLNRSWNDKGQFAAFGRAVHRVQQDEVTFAIYELMTSGVASIDQGWGRERAAALEALHKEHLEWLKMNNVDMAQEYKDIAAMTALVLPFVDKVRNERQGDLNQQRIEARKVIERADDPHELMYTVVSSGGDEQARPSVRVFLNRNADTYFSYDQLVALLEQLPQQPEARTSRYENSIPLTFDDLVAVYAYIRGTHYRTEKEWREFTYKLKLSLAARFPQFYQKKSSDKE